MHIPVLKNEVLKYLGPKPNENFIDCTIDGGGHGLAILKAIQPKGRLLGIDQDEEIIRRLKLKVQKSKVKNNLVLVCDNFVNLKEIVKEKKFKKVSGILFDLGMSTWHLRESGRGFSFMKEESLDMRYSPKYQKTTATEIINRWPPKEIERILKEYGEEKFSKRIVKEIIRERKESLIKTTSQLVAIVKKVVPGWYRRGRIHPATKTFQALRIAVNSELTNLEKTLPRALEILEAEGKLVVISFHSLEDRIVKNFLKEKTKEKRVRILTKKPIRPSREEIKLNPSSRSAKLRAAIKI